MPPRATGRAGRPTFTERARREQLIGVTIDLVAEYGYRGTSLQRIADAAQISKAAVLYHFPSKDAVVAAAYQEVSGELVAHVGAAVDAATDPGAAVAAYLDGLLAHLAARPRHTRLIAEALPDEHPVSTDSPRSPQRWASLAALVAAAQDAGHARPDLDPRTAAIMLNGAVDAVVADALEGDRAVQGARIDAARPAVADLVARLLRP